MSTLTARQQLDNLADWLVEDIMSMSDEEILAEALEDGIDIEENARQMQAIAERAIAEARRRRYAAARWFPHAASCFVLRTRPTDGAEDIGFIMSDGTHRYRWKTIDGIEGTARGKYAAQRAVRRALRHA